MNQGFAFNFLKNCQPKWCSIAPALGLPVLLLGLAACGNEKSTVLAHTPDKPGLPIATKVPLKEPRTGLVLTNEGTAEHQQKVPALYAVVRLTAAAGGAVDNRSMAARVFVAELSPQCPGRVVKLSLWWQDRATNVAQGDPAVVVNKDVLCFKVSNSHPPDIVGQVATARPASLYVINGDEYLGADPDQFEGVGASLFIPAENGGYQVGAFAASGVLESLDEAPATMPVAMIGVSAVWLNQSLDKDHFLLTTPSPGHTQFNVGLTVWSGPDGKTRTSLPGPKYQLDESEADAVSAAEADKGAAEALGAPNASAYAPSLRGASSTAERN